MAQIIDTTSTEEFKETAQAVDSLLDEHIQSVAAESDFDVLSERFHRLVDKEFLGTLTPDEEEELKTLTKWHDNLTTSFYESILDQ